MTPSRPTSCPSRAVSQRAKNCCGLQTCCLRYSFSFFPFIFSIDLTIDFQTNLSLETSLVSYGVIISLHFQANFGVHDRGCRRRLERQPWHWAGRLPTSTRDLEVVMEKSWDSWDVGHFKRWIFILQTSRWIYMTSEKRHMDTNGWSCWRVYWTCIDWTPPLCVWQEHL